MVVSLSNLSSHQNLCKDVNTQSMVSGKTYLAYDKQVGFYFERLSWFQLVIRRFFYCYKSNTHLSRVGLELKKIKIEVGKSKLDEKIKKLVNNIINKHDQKFEPYREGDVFQMHWSLMLSCKEKEIISDLESQIRQNVPINSYNKQLDKLSYKYDPIVGIKIFPQLYSMFTKVETKTNNVFCEISSFKKKVESVKEDIKNTKILSDLEEKIKMNSQLYKRHNDIKQHICEIRNEPVELKDRIKIKISQTLKEKKRIWQPSIKNIFFFTYVVQSSFWEKLSFLFYYFDKMSEIEQNVCLYEKDLDLISYQSAIEAQIKQIGERESVLRRERKLLYENEHQQDLKNIYEEHRRLNDEFESKSSNKNLQAEKEKKDKDKRQLKCKIQGIRSEAKQKCQEISYETEEKLQKISSETEQKLQKISSETEEKLHKISSETEQELQKIKHESEQKRNERKLKNERKLEELNKETSRLQAATKEEFDQKLKVINSNRSKIVQDANKDLQDLLLRCKTLDQEISKSLDSITGNK